MHKWPDVVLFDGDALTNLRGEGASARLNTSYCLIQGKDGYPLRCPRCSSRLMRHDYCGNCGYSMAEDAKEQTIIRTLDDASLPKVIKGGWGRSQLARLSKLVFHIEQEREPLIVEPKERMHIGRSDETNNIAPDLDLGPYGGAKKGVSRLHAALKSDGSSVSIVDLGSTNGTFLNEEHLLPNQTRVLKDGDAVRLGHLVMHVYFKQ